MPDEIKDLEKQIAELTKRQEDQSADLRNAKRIKAKLRLIKAVANIDKDHASLYEVYLSTIEFSANYRALFQDKKHKFVTNKQLERRRA